MGVGAWIGGWPALGPDLVSQIVIACFSAATRPHIK